MAVLFFYFSEIKWCPEHYEVTALVSCALHNAEVHKYKLVRPVTGDRPYVCWNEHCSREVLAGFRTTFDLRPCGHTTWVWRITHRKIHGSLPLTLTNVQQPVSGLWLILCCFRSFREILSFFPFGFTRTNLLLAQTAVQLTASVSTAPS